MNATNRMYPGPRGRYSAARSYHRDRGVSDSTANLVAALILAGILALILWLTGGFNSASNNITCKGSNGVQYWLCIAGQARHQYVTYSIWRSARVGGYYDEGTHGVFRDVGEDPHAPHGVFGHGGGEEGHGFSHGGGGE